MLKKEKYELLYVRDTGFTPRIELVGVTACESFVR
jgi:hypothetical protein